MARIPAAAWDGMFLGHPLTILNSARRRGNTTRTRKLKLDAITYATGGLELTHADTGLTLVYDCIQQLCYDPNGHAIVRSPVSPSLEFVHDGVAELKLFNGANEAANNWQGAAGTYMWLTFIGVA